MFDYYDKEYEFNTPFNWLSIFVATIAILIFVTVDNSVIRAISFSFIFLGAVFDILVNAIIGNIWSKKSLQSNVEGVAERLPALKEVSWLPRIVGIIERLIATFGFIYDVRFIGAWLILKVIGSWGEKSLGKERNEEKDKITLWRVRENIFLIGTAFSIILSFLSATVFKKIASGDVKLINIFDNLAFLHKTTYTQQSFYVMPFGTLGGILLSAFAGGLFAGLWSNFFESRRRIKELRRGKYYEHRNTLVQIEQESIPARLNLSRNLNSLIIAKEGTNANNFRILLRMYKLHLSSGLGLKLLNVELINDYAQLYTIFENINSDIQYLEGVANIITEDRKQGKIDVSLVAMYPVLLEQLYKICLRADKKSLDMLSKCKIIFNKDDKKIIEKYIKNGGQIHYSISSKSILQENNKTIKEETRPFGKNEDKEQFVALYLDVKPPAQA